MTWERCLLATMYFPTVGGNFVSSPGHVAEDRFLEAVRSRARSPPPPARNPDVFFPTVESSFVRSPSPVRSLEAQHQSDPVHAREHGVTKKRREKATSLLVHVPSDEKVSRRQFRAQRSQGDKWTPHEHASETSGRRQSRTTAHASRSQARSELKSADKFSAPDASSQALHASRSQTQHPEFIRPHAATDAERPMSVPDAVANSGVKKRKAGLYRYQFGGVREQERQTKVQAAAQRAQERRLEEKRRCVSVPLPFMSVASTLQAHEELAYHPAILELCCLRAANLELPHADLATQSSGKFV